MVWDNYNRSILGPRQGYYIETDCCIIMYDVTSRITYKNVPNWYSQVKQYCPNIPIVLVGNKVDAEDRKVKPKHMTFHK